MENKFSLTFGKLPLSYIERHEVAENIYNDFNLDYPFSNTYIISGIRGSGKTVLLTKVSRMIDKGEKWIVIDLNPNREILPQIAGEFYENKKSKRVFLTSKFSISFKGFGLTIEGKEPVSNIETVIEKILTLIKDNGFKVLFTIDEVSRNRYLRSFIHDFQSFLRNDYPVYLLMTGLYENVDFLKDSKNLTFLYRAPKIDLKPLNIELIKKEYRKAFPSEKDETIAELSLLTKGYAFAYQVAGFLFDKFKDVGKIHKDFDLS